MKLSSTSSLLEVRLVPFSIIFIACFQCHCCCLLAAQHIHLIWIILSVQTHCLCCWNLFISCQAHRATKPGDDTSRLGQWSWIHLCGRENHHLRIVALYRPCKSNWHLTTYQQQVWGHGHWLQLVPKKRKHSLTFRSKSNNGERQETVWLS